MIVVTLSHYPDLFARFAEGLDRHEAFVPRLLIRDGELIQNVPPNWDVIDAPDVFNYARNVNLAWQETDAHDVILCGDDVQVNGPFIRTLRQTAYSDLKIGVACAQLHGQSPFVCGYFRRDVIDVVGKMDVRFDGYGYEDNDFCRRMEAKGYQTEPVEVPVIHQGGTSFYRRAAEGGEPVQDGADRSRVKFEDKWNEAK